MRSVARTRRRTGQDDAAHGADDRREQEQQHDGAQPGEQGALPALLLGDCAQDLRGLASCRFQRARGLELGVDPADRRCERHVARGKGLVRLLALAVRAHQELAQPYDALEVGARLGEPFRAEHAADALLVLGEERGEGLLAYGDGAHGGRTVAVQFVHVVEVARHLVERAARLDQVVAADDLAEHGPDTVERGLHAPVERLELDVHLVEQPAPGVGSAHDLRAELAMGRHLVFEPGEDRFADVGSERIGVGRAGSVEGGRRVGLGRDARRRRRLDAGENRALELVEGGRQQLGRSVVEAGGDDGRRGDRAHQGVAALGDLVGGNREDGDGAEGERQPRRDAETRRARQPAERAAPGARRRQPPSGEWPQLFHRRCSGP